MSFLLRRKNLAAAAKRHEIEVDLGVEKRQTRPYLLLFFKIIIWTRL